MAVIVDPPLFIVIFNPSDPRYKEYSDVLNWVLRGPAKFVLGGEKYRQELYNIRSVLPKILELKRARKIYEVNDDLVDLEEVRLKRVEPSADFDDPHLVALVNLSKVKIICINDPRAHKFLRRSDFYKSPSMRPKLYTRAKNINLLSKSNLTGICYV